MGLLDDLQMGFGLKERTEDYDARTARTIALNEQYDNEFDRIRARASGDYDVKSGGAAQFLGSRGRESYAPQIADDNRTMFQRLLFSPESTPSPTQYAIGPLTMDQPLPRFGILGLLGGLGGMFGRGGDEMGPPQTTIRPMLRPQGFFPSVSAPPSEVVEPEVTSEQPLSSYLRRYDNGATATVSSEPTTDEMLDALYEVTGDYNAALNDTDGIRKLYQKYVVDRVPFPYDRKRVPPLLADPAIPSSSLNAVDPFRPKESGVDKFGRRRPIAPPSDPTSISGIDFTLPDLPTPTRSDPVVAPVTEPTMAPFADELMTLRSAILRAPELTSNFEEMYGKDMVREALSGLIPNQSITSDMYQVPREPLSRRQRRGLYEMPRITRYD